MAKILDRIAARLKKRNSGGFTLVEVIVSCALLGVLLLGIMMFITPVLNMMKTEKQDTKATSVASAIETYISRSLRSTPYVKVFTNSYPIENYPNGNVAKDSDLMAMREFAKNSNGIYEVRCISILSEADPRTGERRYVLKQEFNNQANTGLVSSGLALDVFDQCFYNGLFPKVTISTVAKVDPDTGNTVQKDDGSGNMVDVIHGLSINVELYDDPELDENESALVFSGKGSTELFMVALDDDTYKIYETREMNTSVVKTNTHGTYIYYIARKLKVPSPSPTPTPTPSPT